MWSYYGSKSKIVDLYPPPKYGKIIEPFAGSAQYALKYWDRQVLINDKYDVVFRIWKWLQQCSKEDILSLPEPKLGEKINREDFDCIEQAWLMGFMVQKGVSTPMLTVSPFAAGTIGLEKKKIASNLFKIKEWEITNNDWLEIENQDATWYVDPPYQNKGYKYKHCKVDFKMLGQWCKDRKGQTIVCENQGADWLPFKKVREFKGTTQKNVEVIWSNIPTNYDNEQSLILF